MRIRLAFASTRDDMSDDPQSESKNEYEGQWSSGSNPVKRKARPTQSQVREQQGRACSVY